MTRSSILASLTAWAALMVVAAAAAAVPPAAADEAAAPPPIVAPIEIDFHQPILRVRTGGAGRYLIVHLPEPSRLAVVDVVHGRVVKELPTPGDFHYAASRDKLVIVLND